MPSTRTSTHDTARPTAGRAVMAHSAEPRTGLRRQEVQRYRTLSALPIEQPDSARATSCTR
jgi:hypothetical protein